MKPFMELVQGCNFSGRSEMIEKLVEQYASSEKCAGILIGADPSNAFSGLAETFSEEIEINSYGGSLFFPGIESLMDLDISTLSGGEQAICAIASALASRARVLALDCTLEQLDHRRRESVIEYLTNSRLEHIILCDNRDREWSKERELATRFPQGRENKEFLTLNSGLDFPPMDVERVSIEVEQLSFGYKRSSQIISDCNFTLEPGKVYHLQGLNGTGKSTLAKLLVGALKPSKGAFRLRNDNRNDMSRRSYLKNLTKGNSNTGRCLFWNRPGKVFSYHFQNPDEQIFCKTVEEEVRIGAARDGRAKEYVDQLTNIAIRILGLELITQNHPQDLPFACRKRVALAATLSCGTPWVILDEPTLGQDDKSAEEIAKIIMKLAGSGRGIIVISHSKSFAEMLSCERLLLDGKKLLRVSHE